MKRTKGEPVSIRLYPELLQAIDREAEEQKLTRTQLIERALLEFLGRNPDWKIVVNSKGETRWVN